MTEEQAQKLVELMQDNQISTYIGEALIVAWILISILLFFLERKMHEKKKKMIQEYKATLTEDQKKAIELYKELTK